MSFFRTLGSTLAIVTLLGLVSPEAKAQQYEGAKLLGFGEARRALADGNDAIYVNPANLSRSGVYSLELGYLDDLRDSDRRVNISIADGQAGDVTGGLAYTYSVKRPSGDANSKRRWEGYRLDIATAYKLTQGFFLGASMRYLNYSMKEDGQDLGPKINDFNVDVGLNWTLFDGLSLGLVGYNLANSENKEMPIAWGLGLGYQAGSFVVEADVYYNAQQGDPRFSGSLGYTIADTVPLRAGLGWIRDSEEYELSIGTGIIFDQLSLDAGYRQVINPSQEGEYADQRVFAIAARLALF